MDVEGKGSERI